MDKFLNNVVMVLVLSIFCFPMSTWGDEDWKELERKASDPCFKVNCNAIRDYIKDLKKAIRAGNRKEVADYMSFPLRVNKKHNGKSIHYIIKNEQEFVAQYNSIITKSVKESILNSNENNIIPNYQGTGIASGTLWLINSTPPIGAYVVNTN